jgi:hypothetical protein
MRQIDIVSVADWSGHRDAEVCQDHADNRHERGTGAKAAEGAKRKADRIGTASAAAIAQI